MKHNENQGRIDTTLGELIEAVSEAVFESCRSNKEAYTLASLVLAEILRSRVSDTRWIDEFSQDSSPKGTVH
ncbi:MAG TPA: hypothetical protein VGL11_04855 [Candidatus Binatia bacterium]|jgi:hypothetical protein